MASNVIVRQYRKGDDEDIVNLLEYVFDGWPHRDLIHSSVEHWQWKFQNEVTRENPSIVVTEEDNQIVGVIQSLPIKINVSKKSLNCNQATDLAIHPDYRGQKLYQKMAELKHKLDKENGDNLNYGVTGTPRVIEISKKRGQPSFPCIINNLIRIQDINLHTEKRKMQNQIFTRIGFKVIEAAKKITSRRKSTLYEVDFEITEINKFDNRHKSFWEKIKPDYDFIIEKTPKFLNWRYCDSRGGDYVVRQIEDNEILGYIVLRVNRFDPDYPRGYIVELIALPGRLDVVDSLISDAVAYFDGLGINVIDFWSVDGHPYVDLFKVHDFLENRINPYVMFSLHDVGPEWEDFMSTPSVRVFFQQGDTDWI